MASKTKVRETPGPSRPAGVLVVDDKPDIRGLLTTRLRLDPGFEVVGEAANGAEAVAEVRRRTPDIVVLDLSMPVLSGEEAIPILRSLAPRARVVVFSAYVGVQSRLAGSLRPDAEVAKGIDLNLLVRELHRVLEAPLEDLASVQTGPMDVSQGLKACESWNQLNPEIRDQTAEPAVPDLLALVGVYVAVGDRLAAAAQSGKRIADLAFETREQAALAAHRALSSIGVDLAAGLEPLYSRLLTALAGSAPKPRATQ